MVGSCCLHNTATRIGVSRPNIALSFASCFIGLSTPPLMLYYADSTPIHAITYTLCHTFYFTLHHAHILNNVVLTIVHWNGWDAGWKSSYSIQLSECGCNKQFITFSHCKIWSHFTHSLYVHLPSTHENMDATRENMDAIRAITCHISHWPV